MTSNVESSKLIGGMTTKANQSHIKAIIDTDHILGFIRKENPNKEDKKKRNKANKAKKWNETVNVEDPFAEDFVEAPDDYDEY